MYNTSLEYKTEIKKPSRSFECKVTIGDRIFYNDDIVDIIIDGNIQPSDGFVIGSITSQTLDLTLLNKGDTIYSTNQIKIEIGLKVGSAIEYILMGYYNIDDVEKTDYTIKFTAFDNMIKFETAYFSSLGDTPTLQQVVNELVSKTGVQFIGSLPAYSVKKLEGFTCREILSYVASLCGGNAVITRDGKFTIVYPKDINYSITADNYFDYKREEVKYKIGKITCQIKEKETISKGSLGTDSMELLFENPWIDETILTDIYNRLNGFEYLGYSLKWQGDISLDVGDIITCTDVKGVVRKLPILSQKFTYTGGLTAEIVAKGESKNKNSFSSSGSMGNKVNRVVTEVALINKAFIDYAHINDADIVALKAQTAKIHNLEVETANINTILAGNIGSGSVQTIHLTGKNVVIDNAVIKDLIAKEISVSDLKASDISTNKFRIVSDSGKMLIADNTIQIKDANRTRVQIGKDAANDYNMYVWDSTGKLMFDATGLKADGIKNKIIRDDMITDNANINGSKINISSLVTEVNKDTNTQLIKASKVALDTTGQSLEISFNSLKSNVDGIQIGGRNLVLNSSFATGDLSEWNNWGGACSRIVETVSNKKWIHLAQNDNLNFRGISQVINEFKPNTPYTISFIAYQANNGTIANISSSDAVIRIHQRNGSNLEPQIWKNGFGLTVKPQKFTFTFVSTNDINKTSFNFMIGGKDGVPFDIYITGIKFEEGNKATDWTQAPEDVDKKITSNTTSINVINGQIDTLIKDTTIEENGATVKLKDSYSALKQTVNGLDSTVSSHETSINTLDSNVTTMQSSITQLNNEISFKVEESDITNAINKNKPLTTFRYIRDSLKGSNINTGNHWVELMVMSNGVNIAQGKIATSNGSIKPEKPVTNYTDGNTDSGIYTEVTGDSWVYLQLDLGMERADIDLVKVWHYYGDGRMYNHRLEVSCDGINWRSLFDSDVSGRYKETTDGRTYVINSTSLDKSISTVSNKVASIETNLTSITNRVSGTESSITTINGNVTSLQTRMSTAEQKITDSAIISTVQSTINNAKTEAINSANSATDTKLQSYTTKASMELTSTQLRLEFKSLGGGNLLKNGRPIRGKREMANWFTSIFNSTGTLSMSEGGENWNGELYKSGIWWKGTRGVSDTWCCLFNNSIENYKFNTNKIYYVSLIMYSPTSGKNININIIDSNGYNSVAGFNTTLNAGYQLVQFHFTPSQSGNKPCLGIYLNTPGDYNFYIPWAVVAEGYPQNNWIPNNNEIEEGNTTISASGVYIDNGGLTVKNNNNVVTIDGQSNMFKIHSVVDFNIDAGGNLEHTRAIYHGLGYTPAFCAFQVDPQNQPGRNVQLPAFSVGGVGTGNLNFNTILRAWADGGYIYITYIRGSLSITQYTRCRVFIYKEALI